MGLAGQALAEAHVFDALYFVIGTVNRNGAPNPVDGRKVVFYQSYPAVVRATVGPPLSASGKFAINIYNNDQIRINPGETYYVAVERDPTLDNWGADSVSVQITKEGWNEVTLNLAEGAGPGGSTEGPDDGLINNTRIERTSDGRIKLLWNYNDPSITSADIFRMVNETDSQFSADPGAYAPITPTSITGTEFIDEFEPPSRIRVGDGKAYYYRVVPAGVTDIFGTDPVTGKAYNKRTVGKVDIRLGDEYNSICYPFNKNYIGVVELMGDQLSEGDQIHWWERSAQTYRILTKLSSGWSADHNFEFGDGFFVYLVPGGVPRSVKLTLVGIVDNFATGITKPLGLEYTLIGYPYPVVRDAGAAGFAPREGDQLHIWRVDSQRFFITTYVGSAWNDLSLINLSVGEGKFYYIPEDRTAYDWAPRF